MKYWKCDEGNIVNRSLPVRGAWVEMMATPLRA